MHNGVFFNADGIKITKLHKEPKFRIIFTSERDLKHSTKELCNSSSLFNFPFLILISLSGAPLCSEFLVAKLKPVLSSSSIHWLLTCTFKLLFQITNLLLMFQFKEQTMQVRYCMELIKNKSLCSTFLNLALHLHFLTKFWGIVVRLLNYWNTGCLSENNPSLKKPTECSVF